MKSKYHIILFLISFLLCEIGGFAQEKLTASDEAKIEQYKKFASQYFDKNNHNQAAQYFTKIAYIYWENKYNKEAIKYFKKSIESNKNIGNKNAIWAINNNIGMIYSDIEDYNKALESFQKSLEAGRELKEKEKIASSLKNIATVQAYLEKYNEANKTLEEALSLSQEMNNLHLIRSCYAALHENCKNVGNNDMAYKYFELYSSFDRKIKLEEQLRVRLEAQNKVAAANKEKMEKELELALEKLKVQQINDSIAKIEQISREKQMKIDLMKKEQKLKEQNAKLEKERLIKRIYVGGLVVVLIFLVVMVIFIIQKLKDNKTLKVKNFQLKEQQETINQKNTELEEKNAELGKKNQQITDSIKYASKIQAAILPSKNAIKENFPDSFIFYMPRDIVSGDFYWFSKQNGNTYIAAVDCTGHSVPGAFMSMIGNTLLNEIVNEKKIFETSEILKRLNIGVVNALKQETGSETDDGMDISLCCVNYKTMELKVSSANHSVLYISNNEMEVIEGDIYSIGGMFSSPSDINFNTHTYKIKKGDIIYIFSDGFPDQFGGPKNKKFMIEKFKNTLFNSRNMDMDKQENNLIEIYNNWRGSNPQTDDVLVIGVKI